MLAFSRNLRLKLTSFVGSGVFLLLDARHFAFWPRDPNALKQEEENGGR